MNKIHLVKHQNPAGDDLEKTHAWGLENGLSWKIPKFQLIPKIPSDREIVLRIFPFTWVTTTKKTAANINGHDVDMEDVNATDPYGPDHPDLERTFIKSQSESHSYDLHTIHLLEFARRPWWR